MLICELLLTMETRLKTLMVVDNIYMQGIRADEPL